MYANQHDGGGGAASYFSGGGFMPSQATQTTDQGGYSKSRSTTSNTTVPVTIKQISEAYHSNDDKSDFVIDGVDPSTVRLLGRVVNKAERVTDVSFLLDDGTGRVDVNRWVHDAFDTNEMTSIENGIYVIVCGKLKGFQGKHHIVAHVVRPVQDFNQITLHFMECIHAHLDNSRLKNPGKAAAAFAASTIPAGMNDTRAYQTMNVGTGASGDLREMVLSVFQEPASLEAIEYHVEVGNIYSTIDDYHFKSACNG
ncbi:replication protein A subunit B-like protein [Carex littledalei]|uniref:Replication protein A subunit B-like protein n=1 Tax=Carex littledalei TaxID=544730 RepID=A0A833VE47_9POAL|nr:replication protein A subunit B-like protein [Carex littledalei]